VTRLWVVGIAAIGLIAFVTFVTSRLIRSRTRGLSVRMQIFLALATIVGAFAFGLGILVIDRVEARASRLAQLAASDEATAISGLIEGELGRTGISLEYFAKTLGSGANKRVVPSGLELLASSRVLLFPAESKRPSKQAGTVFVEVPIRDGAGTAGFVRVVKPTIVIQALLAEIAPTVLVISLVLGFAAAVAAAWIGRAIAAPIEALSDFGEQVSAGHRPPLPRQEFGREVGRLIVAIDTMRRRLEGRPFVETFAADLSHELKNPVAALIASAEVLEDGALDDPASARRFVKRMREAAERIESLTEELLDLALVETRRLETKARLDVVHIARDVVESLGEARARVTFRGAHDLWVRGDAAWIARAIDNLLGNALVHSPPDSTVQLLVEGTPKEVIVQVKNEGEVLPHVRDDIFRRFVTTRRTSGGTGLGLSIVQAVAEAHEGNIEVSSFGPPEVVLKLTLPRA
jgi:two-component system, OmpR family, sensor histidine kinase CreC